MTGSSGSQVRKSATLAARVGGEMLIEDKATGARHDVPPAHQDRIAAALAAGRIACSGADEALHRWLEARHLLETERARAVEAWAAGLAATPNRLELLPTSRFRCHGCGLCCESYVVGPVTEEERAAILAGKDRLAPHAHLPVEEWFPPFPRGGADEGTYALGRQPSGRCGFLGADGLCEVHRHLGEDKKPYVCRTFPLQIARRPDGLTVTINAECGSLARSREDGLPLAEQLAWVAEIAAGACVREAPRLVRVTGDVFVPYRLARAIERRANGFMAAAPRVEMALLAVRDLLYAVLPWLTPPLTVETLERAETLAREGTLEALRAKRTAAADRNAGLSGLMVLLPTLRAGAAKLSEVKGGLLQPVACELAAVSSEVFAAFHDAISGKGGPGSGSEAEALLAVEDGAVAPAVVDFTRALFAELSASGRPLFAAPGLLFGFAFLAMFRELVAFGARLFARRRGATQAAPEDWNKACVAIERTLRCIDLASYEREVIACLELPGQARPAA